jgi:hypothetical protein
MKLHHSREALRFVLTATLSALLVFCFHESASLQNATPPLPGIETSYDSAGNKTTVRLTPVKISGEKGKYHSIHITPSFSYPGRNFLKPATIDFELQTVVKTKLKVDLYVVFIVDGETIFLSSNRSGVRNPVPGKRWIGERLVFRMPYDTLMKVTKAKAVEIKMDEVRFPLTNGALERIREFARHTDSPQ